MDSHVFSVSVLLTWRQDNSLLWVLFTACGVFSSVPGLCPLATPAHLWQQKKSPDIAKCSWGAEPCLCEHPVILSEHPPFICVCTLRFVYLGMAVPVGQRGTAEGPAILQQASIEPVLLAAIGLCQRHCSGV